MEAQKNSGKNKQSEPVNKIRPAQRSTSETVTVGYEAGWRMEQNSVGHTTLGVMLLFICFIFLFILFLFLFYLFFCLPAFVAEQSLLSL